MIKTRIVDCIYFTENGKCDGKLKIFGIFKRKCEKTKIKDFLFMGCDSQIHIPKNETLDYSETNK